MSRTLVTVFFMLHSFTSTSFSSSTTMEDTIDCRLHNHLYVCTSLNSSLMSVVFEDANAVQTIDDVELHLENQGISDIDDETFIEAKNATALYLSDNKLSKLSKHYFNFLEQLTYLDLKNNVISDIEDAAFAKLTNLETLLLDYNFITRLSPPVWKGLASLRELYVTNNTIVLRRNMFRGLRQLETLALDSNEIDAVPVGTFNGLNHMDLLYLSRNNIVDLHPDVFRGLDQVNELDLGKNRIERLPNGIFRNMRSLESLWLNGNRISSLMQPGTFNGLKRLCSLFLSNNEINTIDFVTFREIVNASIEPGFIVDDQLLSDFEDTRGTFRCTSGNYDEPYVCERTY